MAYTSEEKKQREIAKWEREKAKAAAPGYIIYFLLIICVVYICDEVATQIGGQMQSIVASQLFAPIVGEEPHHPPRTGAYCPDGRRPCGTGSGSRE